MNKVIKPCPFCGGEACVQTTTKSHIPVAFVYCKKCNSVSALFPDTKRDGTFLFDAIDAWNCRAGEDGKHETL